MQRPDIETMKKILENANDPKQYYLNQGFYDVLMLRLVPELIDYIDQLEERNKVLVQALKYIIKYQQQSYNRCPYSCQKFIDARDIAKFALGSDIKNE